MVYKSLKYICATLVAATLISIAIAAPNTYADVGELPTPGGSITSGDKIDSVAMKSEEVVFKIRKNDGTFDQSWVSTYAHVKATFVMSNLTDQAQTKSLFFPFHSGTWSDPQNSSMNQAKNAKVTVDGKNSSLTYKDNVFDSSGLNVASAAFSATFPAKTDTTIVVEYDLRAVNEAKSQDLGFSYMMETGSHWAGKIGQGKVVFDFEKDLDSSTPIIKINDFFNVKDGNLEWEFTDLEPTSDQNIELVFNTDTLDIWSKHPAIITRITASRMQSHVYQSANIRSYGDYPGGLVSTNAINLIDYSKDNAGWLMTQSDEKFDEWVEFTLNGKYTIKELSIRGGYLSSSFENNKDEKYYDTYRRPKDMTITYSDGSVQSVKLQDKPSEYQTIKLNNTETTSLRLNFKDAYDGVGGGYIAFGVGRVKLVDAVKVQEKPADTQQTADTNSFNYLAWIIGGGAVAALLAVLGAFWVFRKKIIKNRRIEKDKS